MFRLLYQQCLSANRARIDLFVLLCRLSQFRTYRVSWNERASGIWRLLRRS